MKKQALTYLCLLSVLLLTAQCSKKEDKPVYHSNENTSVPADNSGCPIHVTASAPQTTVNAGQDFKLQSVADVEWATFSWTGPDGFHSHEVSPTVVNPGVGATGKYTVKIVKGKCTDTSSVRITVKPVYAPCSSATNILHPSKSGLGDLVFTDFTVTKQPRQGYEIKATGPDANITITFNDTTVIPQYNKIYHAGDYADINMKLGVSGSWQGYYDCKGSLYFDMVNGHRSFTFCDLQLLTFYDLFTTASGNITVK